MPTEKDNKLFYGVELELECVANRPPYYDQSGYRIGEVDIATPIADAAVADMGSNAIAKFDGTITHGFELVTVPATLRYHREKMWDKFFANSALMMVSRPNCGLHIHFSRDGVTSKALAKAMYFYHDDANSYFLTKIAGRRVDRSASWNVQHKKSFNGEGDVERIIREETGSRSAISVSRRNNGKSVEVRIFASNNSKQGVMQAIEFVDSSLAYTNDCGDAEKYLCRDAFLGWYHDTKAHKRYPFLDANLVRIGLIKRETGVAVLTRTNILSNLRKKRA